MNAPLTPPGPVSVHPGKLGISTTGFHWPLRLGRHSVALIWSGQNPGGSSLLFYTPCCGMGLQGAAHGNACPACGHRLAPPYPLLRRGLRYRALSLSDPHENLSHTFAQIFFPDANPLEAELLGAEVRDYVNGLHSVALPAYLTRIEEYLSATKP